MLFKLYIGAFLIIVLNCLTYAQENRVRAMGGITYGISDQDYSLNPYDLGNNPAWLQNDDTVSWLRIQPSLQNEHGDYKRYYDPRSTTLYGLGFKGIKTLGTDGTFLGETDYSYELRKDVPRSLKYDTYGGEAFFMTDTNSGGFRYNGPSVRFKYSYQLFPSFFIGADAHYKILDGLKDVYSRASILYRKLGGDFGVTYSFTDAFSFGILGMIGDEQEKIESADVDLTEVEIFNYRGETFSIRKRAGSVKQKIKKKMTGIGTQIYYFIPQNFELGVSASYKNSKEDILVPYSTATQSFAEYGEGFSSFNIYDIIARGRYFLSPQLQMGGTFEIHRNSSWSKNPSRDLLLWEWNVTSMVIGIGGSYKFNHELLLSTEYEITKLSVDSSKYIDSRYSSFGAVNHILRFGFEEVVTSAITIRGGYNYGYFKKEMLGGRSNVSFHSISTGGAYEFNNNIAIDISLIYNITSPGGFSTKRSSFDCFITTRLYNF